MNDDPSSPQRPPPADSAVTVPPEAVPGKPAKPVKSRNNGLSLLLALAALLGTGGLGWLYQQQQGELRSLQAAQAALQAQNETARSELAALQQSGGQLESALEERLSANLQATLQQRLQNSLAEIENRQAELQANLRTGIENYLQTEMRATSNRLDTQQGQLEALTREVASISQRITSTSGAGEAEQDWLLGEAESLLRLAQQQLLLEQDAGAAIRLFIAADELLGSSANAAVFSVRELLATELAALQALRVPDMEALYVRLGEQSQRIDALSVRTGTDPSTLAVPAAEQDTLEAPGGWFDSAKETLSQYFVVTRRDEVIEPLMTAEQQVLIRRSIQLQIEQARLALLQRQPGVYRAALDAAIAAINERLQQDDASVSVAQALADLRDTPVTIDIPEVNATLAALQRVRTAAASAGETR